MALPISGRCSLLYPQKIPENLRLSGVFKGYKMKTLAGIGIKCLQ